MHLDSRTLKPGNVISIGSQSSKNQMLILQQHYMTLEVLK